MLTLQLRNLLRFRRDSLRCVAGESPNVVSSAGDYSDETAGTAAFELCDPGVDFTDDNSSILEADIVKLATALGSGEYFTDAYADRVLGASDPLAARQYAEPGFHLEFMKNATADPSIVRPRIRGSSDTPATRSAAPAIASICPKSRT